MKRPLAITVWAIILALFAIVRAVGLAGAYTGGHSGWRPESLELGLFSLVVLAIQACAAVGLWANRRWAVVIYLAWSVIGFLLVFLWSARGIAPPPFRSIMWIGWIAVFAATTLPNWNRMRPGLFGPCKRPDDPSAVK